MSEEMDKIIDEALLEERLAALEAAHSWSPRVVSKLEALIRSADDYGLFRINPLGYADDHGIDEDEAIDLFLHATSVGLFDMEWLIVCGACSNVYRSFRKLESVDPHFVCELCTNENEADLDELIQITFTIAPQVRSIAYHHPESLSVEDRYFRYQYSADVKPLATGLTVPETLRSWTKALEYLEPGDSLDVELDLPFSFIGVWDVLSPISALFVANPELGDDGTRIDLEIVDGGFTDLDGRPLDSWHLEIPEGRSLYVPVNVEANQEKDEDDGRPPGATEPRILKFDIPALSQIPIGPLKLSVHNGGIEKASIWIVQYPRLPDQGAFIEFMPVLTAKMLLSNQTFRRLFRSETVPESETLQVRDLTYLFTDLKDSTIMYDRVGDVNAYDLVRRHFDALAQAVAQNSGAVVKTIGDAIMATFVAPADAVRAAIDMQTALAEFNSTASTDLSIKIGIHRGRSIAVNLNDRIDHFGQDVNIASRIQELAGVGEIVVSEDVYRSPGVGDLVQSAEVAEEAGIMRGVSDMIPVVRIRPAVN